MLLRECQINQMSTLWEMSHLNITLQSIFQTSDYMYLCLENRIQIVDFILHHQTHRTNKCYCNKCFVSGNNYFLHYCWQNILRLNQSTLKSTIICILVHNLKDLSLLFSFQYLSTCQTWPVFLIDVCVLVLCADLGPVWCDWAHVCLVHVYMFVCVCVRTRGHAISFHTFMSPLGQASGAPNLSLGDLTLLSPPELWHGAGHLHRAQGSGCLSQALILGSR